jgi:hypothetical protein
MRKRTPCIEAVMAIVDGNGDKEWIQPAEVCNGAGALVVHAPPVYARGAFARTGCVITRCCLVAVAAAFGVARKRS